MVAFNHTADDAGVMLLLLDVMYSACQMLRGYHYYCQKIIFISLYVESKLLSTVCMCVCACVLLHATVEVMVLKLI